MTDNGIGIPPHEQPCLFSRFYRAANARHTTVAGTGLGLCIVRVVISAHHGTIAVEDA